jgi:hypothetical protein
VREDRCDDALARLHACDTLAERHHLASAIAQRDRAGRDGERVAAELQDADLAVVQRAGVHAHQDLARTGLRDLALAQLQPVEPGAEALEMPALHGRPFV